MCYVHTKRSSAIGQRFITGLEVKADFTDIKGSAYKFKIAPVYVVASAVVIFNF